MKINKEQTVVETPENISKSSAKRHHRRHRIVRNVIMAVVHSLGVGAIVGLSVALYFSQDKINMQAKYQTQMESVYARAYYNLLDGVNDIDTTMAKLTVAKSSEKQEALLYEIWCASTLAEEYLATFENQDEGVRTAVKFVNQLGDYSLYLAGKLANGQVLGAEDRETLKKMKPMADVLKESLKKVGADLEGGKLFLEEDGVLESFSGAFSEFNEPDFDYPEMIYDGPFSDSLESMTARGLEGLEEITETAGRDIISKLFDGATDVTYIGRFEGKIPTENYSFKYKGYPAYVQLSVNGGRIVNYTLAADTEDGAESIEHGGEVALEFANKLGYENLEVVWSAVAHGYTYVNLAPVQDGIILYPDLIKVKIDNMNGLVVGFDSAHHAYNHRPREIWRPTISEAKARQNLSITPLGQGRLALIPDGGEKETLCYEYECESDGTYFIYIDAMTGAETEILYVIDDVDQGQTLI